jgi:hypothetical protein
MQERTSEVEKAVSARPSGGGAAPRTAVVLALGAGGELTLAEIEREAGSRLAPARPPAPIEEYVDELVTVGLIEHKSDARSFALTPAGIRRYNGILALSRG